MDISTGIVGLVEMLTVSPLAGLKQSIPAISITTVNHNDIFSVNFIRFDKFSYKIISAILLHLIFRDNHFLTEA